MQFCEKNQTSSGRGRKQGSHPKRDIFLVVMLVYLSGHTLLTHTPKYLDIIFVSYALFLILLSVNSGRRILAPKMVFLMFAFAGIFAMQIVLGVSPKIITIMGFYMKLVIAFLTIRLVDEFLRMLVTVMYWLAIISLGFWAFQCVTPSGAYAVSERFRPINQLTGIYQEEKFREEVSILVHQYDFHKLRGFREMAGIQVARNSGAFHEPGPFAGAMLLALMALGLRQDAFSRKQYLRILFVLLFCILSTISTMGVALAPLLFLFCILKLRKIGMHGYLASIILVSAIVYAIVVSGMVQERLEHDYRLANEEKAGSRIGGLLLLIPQVKERPIVGWGLHNEQRFERFSYIEHEDYGNGLLMVMVRFGLTGFFLIMLAIADSYRQYVKKPLEIPYLMIVTLAMIGGNAAFMQPLFMSFWALPSMESALFNIRHPVKAPKDE